ncbi:MULTISPECIES: branched-chain amino acid ABC transporter permease [Burkholderia]|uniref:ABC transporter permease n=1 Tax=Burkholderia aenigmatica TaxID=2015348 RepID=A0ABY6XWY7_9BURK|nr:MULTISPECIES: branched-chain amino acid ABC transporter permease [Burkholderia]VWC66852.1 ABC transporter permease [Burkholderia aenigmatica]VWC91149.1 ABC transporter permease [Burkholderia aenigmatica]
MTNLSNNPATSVTAGQIRNALSRSTATASVPVAVTAVLLVLVGIVVPRMGDYALEVGFRLLLLLTIAEAWNLMSGFGGMVSLGAAAFFGAGAYSMTGLVNLLDMPPWLAVPMSGFTGAVLSVVVSRGVFRLRGLYFTVGTLALAEALRLFMVNYSGFGGASGLVLALDPPGLRTLFLMALALATVTIVLMSIATRSRFSVLLRAVRDDEDAASQMGVRTFRIKLLAFLVSSALTSIAGALQALKLGTVEPYGTFGIQWTVSALSIVIIGGQGKRAGPFLGAIFVVALGELLADWPALHFAITGAILITVIRFAPQGIAGLLQKIANRKARS